MKKNRQEDASMPKQTNKNSKRKHWELLLVLLFLVPVGLGGYFVLTQLDPEKHMETEQVLASQAHLMANPSSQHEQQASQHEQQASQAFPENFEETNVADDRYTIAIDPETGEMLIRDNLAEGGIGANTTSVEGQRMMLAKDMMDLDAYAEANQGNFSAGAYQWLKGAAAKGMDLAYGDPGAPPEQQADTQADNITEYNDHISDVPMELLRDSYISGMFDNHYTALDPTIKLLYSMNYELYITDPYLAPIQTYNYTVDDGTSGTSETTTTSSSGSIHNLLDSTLKKDYSGTTKETTLETEPSTTEGTTWQIHY